MALVTLVHVWVNLAVDPSIRMRFSYVSDGYSWVKSRGGGVEGGYASGRVRSWSTPERRVSAQMVLRLTTPEQRAFLEAAIGEPVWLRDHIGHKAHGVFHELPMSVSTLPPDFPSADNAINLSFTGTTGSEAV